MKTNIISSISYKNIGQKGLTQNPHNLFKDSNKSSHKNIYSIGLINKAWVDIKRNYCVKDFETQGAIKQNKLLTNKYIKPFFDFAELKLKNVHKTSDKYFRGGALSCEYDILRLKDMGVSDIVNLLEPSKHKKGLSEFAQKQGLNYHYMPLSGMGTPTLTQIEDFLDITQKSKGAVYVHCLHGKDRTGLMSLIYETEVLKHNSTEAFESMINIGMNARKNPKMIEFLVDRYPELKILLD